jgi:hypothetical protein
VATNDSKKQRDSLWEIFIPFGKEGDIGDEVMTKIIQQQNIFLRSTKQCIVQNLNGVDCPIDIVTGSAEDRDAATVTLRDIFYQYKDDDGGQLFDAIEKTNTGSDHPVSQQGTISRLINLKRKMEEIDRERAAFKIKQSKLEKEVTTVTFSLKKPL